MRSRLIALIVIPTAAAIVLGGLRVTTSLTTAGEYERVHTVAQLADDLSRLVDELQLERDLSARHAAQGRQSTGRANVRKQYEVVDEVVGEVSTRVDAVNLDSGVLEALGTRGRTELTQIRRRIAEFKSMRETATGANSAMPAKPVIDMYSRTIADLLALHDEIIQGISDQDLAGNAAAFGSLARAKEQASRERAELAIALAAGQFGAEGLNAMLAARAQLEGELAAFRTEASVAQRQLYDDTVSSQKKDRAAAMRARAIFMGLNNIVPLQNVDVSTGRASDQAQWFDVSSDIVSRMRTVEKQVATTLIGQSQVLQSAEQRGALIAAGLIGLLIVLVLIVTAIMARSLVRPLRTLRTEALSIAGQRLPETVQTMRETGEVSATDITPIGVSSEDEIGEVARAFDEVHREAVRLAGQEATLRSNVNAMFVNLSRRSQTLVERQLSLIESLEQGEQDEGRLGSLFRLDHLATRMRRNSENLLVLAGQEPARRWSQPVPLIDVVRASLSEVENYERVDLQLSAGVSVAGTSVNDVVHLIAELVENAISFSPRETKVIVSSNRIDGGGVMVSVTDIGIGMTAEELAGANWRLANPPVVDVSVSRRMGLFVVGRLALRHGIRVQLRQQDSGGLTAMVLLPENLLAVTARPGAPAGMTQSGDWGASMGSMDRAPVMASPTAPPDAVLRLVRGRAPELVRLPRPGTAVQLLRGPADPVRRGTVRPGARRHPVAGTDPAARDRTGGPRLARDLPSRPVGLAPRTGTGTGTGRRPPRRLRRMVGRSRRAGTRRRPGLARRAEQGRRLRRLVELLPARRRLRGMALHRRPRAVRAPRLRGGRQHRPAAGGARLLAHGGGQGGVPADLRGRRVRLVQEGRAGRRGPGTPPRGPTGPGPRGRAGPLGPGDRPALAARGPGAAGRMVISRRRRVAGGQGRQRPLPRRDHRLRAAQAGAQGEPGARYGHTRPGCGPPSSRPEADRLPRGGAQQARQLPAGSTAGPGGRQGRGRRGRAAVSRLHPGRRRKQGGPVSELIMVAKEDDTCAK
ncbi:hypothetical protein GCM10017559_07580 [Streptosporangium longisporum]|uniref:histidine kinase n=1 Tax=Streptosporangium longisporum TaxID=46187 RepID=A0ABN3XTC0_9ACTN